MIAIVKILMILESMRKIWNDRELEYSCTTVKEDAELPDRHLPEKSFNAKIRNIKPIFELNYWIAGEVNETV